MMKQPIGVVIGRIVAPQLARNARRDADKRPAIIACDKREAFAQGNTCDEAIQSWFLLVTPWIASLRSQ
jgi:hypothetical protein